MIRSALPAKLRPENVIVAVDSREKLPWDLTRNQVDESHPKSLNLRRSGQVAVFAPEALCFGLEPIPVLVWSQPAEDETIPRKLGNVMTVPALESKAMPLGPMQLC